MMAHGTLFKEGDRKQLADAQQRVVRLREMEELLQNSQDCLELVKERIEKLGGKEQPTAEEIKRLQAFQQREQDLTKTIQDLTNALTAYDNGGSNSNEPRIGS